MKRVVSIFCMILALASFAAPVQPKVAVVAHEPGYYTSLANHIQRWLKGAEVQSAVVTPKEMPSALAAAKIAFFVGFVEPTEGEVKQIASFIRQGGKAVVFYTASPALANLMGVKVLGYKTAPYPGAWSRMDFDTSALPGCPRSILQTSTVLQRAVPVKGRGYAMANWLDRSGKASGEAAWIKTDAGFWMTHVLLADGDEALKAQLLAAMCGSADKTLWNTGTFAAKEKAKADALKAYAAKQVPRKGEIHAVWDHSGCGLYPGDWGKTIALLKASQVTDLFVNVAGAGFAHYPSKVLPRSKIFEQEGDQLAQCLAAAKGSGIRVHAWVLCFTATRSTPDRLEIFRKKGWRLKDRDGRLTEYLDPSNKEVRDHLIAAIDELQAKYGIDGVHLDFVRWYERSEKPNDATDTITRFVAEARRHVKRPCWLTTAVLGKYPSCIAAVGQDWDSWLSGNLVDYVVPMDYTESLERFESFASQHASSASHARRTIAGVGVTANESRLDAKAV
ncbi:MAG: family 10 glycosylhydrolase, partial [Kiritimatiellae bacterium]|nr:family 10 glycosylhydrolase [Kiritimatiellia bacterium]